MMHTCQQDYKRCIKGGLKWSFSASEINVKSSVAIIDFGGLLGKKKYTYKETQKHQCSLWAFVRTEGKQKIFLWSDRSKF